MSNESAPILAGATVTVAASPERVWQALTDPVLVKEYFFGTTLSTDWEVGSDITYSGEWNGEAYEDKGVVLKADKPSLLVTSFFSPSSGKEDVPENYQTVSYAIEAIDGGSRLTVTQDNNESAESAEHSSSNWQTILDALVPVAERG